MAAIIVLKKDMLPDLKRILRPSGWLDILTYIQFPFFFITLHLWRNDLALTELLWRYLLLTFGYVIAIYDILHKEVPNSYILALLAAWVVISIPQLFIQIGPSLKYLFDSLFGFLIGGGLFLLVYIISKKGLGGGDVKYMAVAGLYLGMNGVLAAIFFTLVFSVITGWALILLKRIGRKDTLPFAPFLYIGFLAAVFIL